MSVLQTAWRWLVASGHDQLVAHLEQAEVPNFPETTASVLRLLRADEPDSRSIADELTRDPGLSLRVLRMVNSAAFGLRRPVTDIAHGVSILGRATVESVVIGAAVRDALPGRRTRHFDPARFWATSAHRAATATALSAVLEPGSRAVAFTAGLLQDMAVPLLLDVQPGYDEVLGKAKALGAPLDELERGAWGWDHAELGRSLCARWGLPDELGDAIGGHHRTGARPRAVGLVALLDSDEHGTGRILEAVEDWPERDAIAGVLERCGAGASGLAEVVA